MILTRVLEEPACPFPPIPHNVGFATPMQHLFHAIPFKISTTGFSYIPAVILASWSVVHATHSSAQDVVYGVILDDQSSIVPLKASMKNGSSIVDFCHEMQRFLSGITVHSHSTVDGVSKNCEDASQVPKFQTVVDVRNLFKARTPSPGVHRFRENAKGTVHITCQLIDKYLGFTSNFDATLVSSARMQNILYGMGHVATQLVAASPNTALDDLEVISPHEMMQIRSWNYGLSLDAEGTCVHDTISAWAQVQPSAEAIYAWDKALTYAELDRFATSLSLHLNQLGAGKGDIIPICFERSALAIVVMLAVLKTGSAFVPLEHSNPVSRNLEIVQQSGAHMVLVSSEQSQDWINKAATFPIDWDLLYALPPQKKTALRPVDPTLLAYIIFTSGSTGNPKGVMIEHRSLSLSLKVHGPGYIYNQNTSSRVLQFASLAFDASMTEHLAPLSHGGCVCIPDHETRMGNIAEFMNAARVNWAFFTPSFFKLIQPHDVPLLKTVVLGGEAITDDCIDRWAARITLINGYGPSETTIVATACRVYPNSTNRASIGTGLACRTWVVDVDDVQRLLPVGLVGELLIQGPTVGRGYLNDEEKTGAAFISTPRWLPQIYQYHRLYKTGDVVRLETDGSITYLGRKDTQVKIRGQRIELSEIESRISSQPEVQHVAVFAPKDGLFANRLVAVVDLRFLSLSSTNSTTRVELVPKAIIQQANAYVASIRDSISQLLPSYMVPDIWIPIDAMPISNSGKAGRSVVRAWLARMDEETYHQIMKNGTETGEVIAKLPTSRAEKILCSAWAYALNLDPASVSIDIPFQALQGDSISAIQAVTRCRKDNLQVKVADILRGDTIAQLAVNSGSIRSSTIQVKTDCQRSFKLSPIQQMYAQHAPQERHHFNQSILLRVTKPVSEQSIWRSLSAVVQRHPVLRVRFHRAEQEGWTQRITGEVEKSFTFQTHNIAASSDARSILSQSQSAVDAIAGPVFHADLITMDGSSQLLFLVAHHIVIDLISWRIIIDDLNTYIDTGCLGVGESVSFQTWCELLEDHVRKFWPPSKALPYTIPSAGLEYWGMQGLDNVYGDVMHIQFTLALDTKLAILDACHKIGCELLDLFLATLLQSFAKVFDDRELPPVFNEGHGRELWDAEIDISATVGWFTTLCPIIPCTSPEHSILEAVRRVQHTRKSIPHNGLIYFASRFLDLRESGVNMAEIVFNYMGSFQNLDREDPVLQLVPGSLGISGDFASANMRRFSLLEISARMTEKNQIEFTFSYNQHMKHRGRIELWAAQCARLLEQAAEELGRDSTSNRLCEMSLMSINYEEASTFLNNVIRELGITYHKLEAVYPTSAIQNAMLVAQDGPLGCYRTRLALNVTGAHGQPVDSQTLHEAWNKVVQYHSILRTVFVRRAQNKNTFDQVVLRKTTAMVEHISLSESTSFHHILNVSSPESSSWSPLQPCHRLTIYKVGEDQLACLLEISHALIDQASLAPILDDLARFYSNNLPTHPATPYSTLVKHIAGQDPIEAIKYWNSILPNDTEPCHLTFPISSSTTDPQSMRIRHTIIPLSSSTKSLLSNASLTKYTPSTVLRTAWALLLQQHTGSSSPIFGYVVSGRDVPIDNIGSIAGPFLNILACRISLAGTPNRAAVTTLLENMQTQFLESLPYQHHFLTFAAQQQHLRTRNGNSDDLAGGAPTRLLFNTLFNFRRNMSAARTEEGELAALDFKPVGEEDPFDVSLISHFSPHPSFFFF